MYIFRRDQKLILILGHREKRSSKHTRGGEIKGVKSIEIGKQLVPGDSELIDTLLHEELEARIFFSRPTKKHKELSKTNDNNVIHPYIDEVIKRYRRLKGI
ncbi:MAG: hypothetical protein RR347_09125 [Anaerovoracaceae bacterium]